MQALQKIVSKPKAQEAAQEQTPRVLYNVQCKDSSSHHVGQTSREGPCTPTGSQKI